MKLVLKNKTGFMNKTPLSAVIIADSRGIIFYNTTEIKRPVSMFNLPSGEYTIIKGNIQKLRKPVHYRLPSLPSPERNIKPPFDYRILFAENPNKCSIFWDRKEIVFDSSFLQAPQYELFFILFHEYGHALYKSEHLADLAAVRLMLIRGYNPSQVGKAPITSLSTAQGKRKNHVVNKLLKR
jgi:hypothetical protein